LQISSVVQPRTTISWGGKGKVEGLVGYSRRNFMVPIPHVSSWEELNAHLQADCRKRRERRLRGHAETIGERFERDRAMLPLPAVPYEKISARVSSLSLVRYRANDYSVPTEYGHRQVWVKGYVHEVVIACGSAVIARHQRSYEREAVVFDPLHYLHPTDEDLSAGTPVWRCLSRRPEFWIKSRRSPDGNYRSALRNCDVCWKQDSRSKAAASMYRC